MTKKIVLEKLGPFLILFLLIAVFRFRSSFWVLFFGLGGIVGTFILGLEEALSIKLEIKEKVFHTYLFQVIFAVLSFYVLTSTASALASGVCLFAYLRLTYDQVIDASRKNMTGWGGFFGLVVPQKFQNLWVGGGILTLLYFVYILIR